MNDEINTIMDKTEDYYGVYLPDFTNDSDDGEILPGRYKRARRLICDNNEPSESSNSSLEV